MDYERGRSGGSRGAGCADPELDRAGGLEVERRAFVDEDANGELGGGRGRGGG